MKNTLLLFITALSINANAQNTIIGGDSTTFPVNSNFAHIDTAAGNVWQIGVPQKPFFDTAHSVPYAIMTDTINSYPINNLSTFTVQFTDTNNWIGDAYIGFWHKYQMDSLKDGGWVEISLDSGATWANVANTSSLGFNSNGYQSNFYNEYSDTIQGNIPAFTGTHNTWEYSFIKLYWVIVLMPTNSNTNSRSINPNGIHKVMFRFVFKSDGVQTNKAGWIIDDIAIRIYDIGGGINKYSSSDFDVEVYPNPTKGELRISSKKSGIKEVRIVNVLGEEMLKQAQNDKRVTIDVSTLAKGIYFVQIMDENKNVVNKKVVIQ